jgi:hypothetical protein
MSDPTLKRTNVTIGYTGSDGYRAEATFNQRHTEGGPEKVFLYAFEELSRLLHLFGFGDEAIRLAQEAAERVRVSQAERTAVEEDGK